MKRDMDLVRVILLAMEANPDPQGPDRALTIEGVEDGVVAYHVKLLVDAELLEGIETTSSDGLGYIPTSLTWSGHEFLDFARNDTLWKRAKALVLEKTGGLSFDVLKATLTKLAIGAVSGAT